MIVPLLTAATVLGGTYFLHVWFKKSGAANETRFREKVLRDAAGFIAGRVGAAPDAVLEALEHLIETGATHPLLAILRGLECEVTKLSPSTARRTVLVLVEDRGEHLIGRVACELSWDELPDSVRQDFIRLGGETQIFRIITPATTGNQEVNE